MASLRRWCSRVVLGACIAIPAVAAADLDAEVPGCPPNFPQLVREVMQLRDGRAPVERSGASASEPLPPFDLRFDLALVINDYITRRDELSASPAVSKSLRALSVPELRNLRDAGEAGQASCEIVRIMRAYYSGELEPPTPKVRADVRAPTESSATNSANGEAPRNSEPDAKAEPPRLAASESQPRDPEGRRSTPRSERGADPPAPVGLEPPAAEVADREPEPPVREPSPRREQSSRRDEASRREASDGLASSASQPPPNPRPVSPRQEAPDVASAASPTAGSNALESPPRDLDAAPAPERELVDLRPEGSARSAEPATSVVPQVAVREEAMRFLERMDELLRVPVYLSLAELRRQNLTLPDTELGERRRRSLEARDELLELLEELARKPEVRREVDLELGAAGVDRFADRLERSFAGRRARDQRKRVLEIWIGDR